MNFAGHTQAVEGCLDAYSARITGMEAEYVQCLFALLEMNSQLISVNSDIEHIWQMLYRFGFYRGGPVMMSALAGVRICKLKIEKRKLIIVQVDIALWDLKARRLGVPIYQLLGGKVRDTLKVYAWIGGDRPGDVEIQA